MDFDVRRSPVPDRKPKSTPGLHKHRVGATPSITVRRAAMKTVVRRVNTSETRQRNPVSTDDARHFVVGATDALMAMRAPFFVTRQLNPLRVTRRRSRKFSPVFDAIHVTSRDGHLTTADQLRKRVWARPAAGHRTRDFGSCIRMLGGDALSRLDDTCIRVFVISPLLPIGRHGPLEGPEDKAPATCRARRPPPPTARRTCND